MERLAAHEAFEIAVLQGLRGKGLLQTLVFGGGTMLRLCHELPRYSLDMDFWFFKQVDVDGLYRLLEGYFQKEYEVTDMENKYYSILVEVRRTPGMPKLKIEVRKALAPPGSTEEKIAFSPSSPVQVLVRGFTLRQMFRNKVLALIDRGEIRDAFDLEFMLRRGVSPDFETGEVEKIIHRLKGFKKKDFDVTLGSVLLPDWRDYYRQNRFSYLEEKLMALPKADGLSALPPGKG